MDNVIVKLSDRTIQLIAAGEVITRPVNVVKELLENSIDAGSTNIRIFIDQGGMKSIEIVDNGHGIAKFNASLVCQRHTTSKLSNANDLSRIATFGFRGEALSSISEMADLEITSFNMHTDTTGWSAKYAQGKPETICDKYVQFPGTQIKVTNLFANMMPRKGTLAASFLDEKKAIIDLVSKMAIHHRERITMVLTDKVGGELICSIAPIQLGPSIGSFYGMDMENNLLDFNVSPVCEAKIYVAFSYKKSSASLHQSNMILFVNDRLVECDDLRKEMYALILEYLSIKQFVSLVYISIKVPATDVDVNCHPAKETVILHYQQEMTAKILTQMRSKLESNLSSQVVPTNNSQQKTIGELLKRPSSSQVAVVESHGSPANQERLRLLAPNCLTQPQPFSQVPKRPCDLVHTDASQMHLTQMLGRVPPTRVRRDLKLNSLISLRTKVAEERAPIENCKIIRDSVFVGIFDHTHALIQIQTRLYSINFKEFVRELIYQMYLFDFGNFPPIDILPPGNQIQFLIEIYLNDLKKHNATEFEKLTYKTPQDVVIKLQSHSSMLDDYLILRFTTTEILTIPNIIPEHVPNLIYLGQFLVNLANKVDFSQEIPCFHRMGRLIAEFYCEPPANLKNMKIFKRYHDFVKKVTYEAIKRYLIPPEWLFDADNICQVTDTKDLYKVFERC